MALTGDLENLHIVDIIQLIHSTRKSGIFSVKGDKGVSRIVFSNGSIVGANHLNNSVRIGTVLVKTGVITVDDLKQAMSVVQTSDKSRTPLLATLVLMGKLKRDDALRGLKKLVELTIVELMSWKKGTFMFDMDTTMVLGEGGQDLGVDSQMVLMDALRIFDERERDNREGKVVHAFETLYADVLPEDSYEAEPEDEPAGDDSLLTADDLGLADLDRLEKRISRTGSVQEIFDPAAIHRRKIKELLPGFSPSDQEAFFSFLKSSLVRKATPEAAEKQACKAIVYYSRDPLMSHSIMSLCNGEGALVFVTDDAGELDRILAQCLLSSRMPVAVFDDPLAAEGGFSREAIESLRQQVSEKYAAVPMIQFADSRESDFVLQSYHDGVRAVFPKPSREDRKETYIQDAILFLGTFKSYVMGFQCRLDNTDSHVQQLKDGIMSLCGLTKPSDALLVVLTAVSRMFERAVILVVRSTELSGEIAIGVGSDKSVGPVPADGLKIPLTTPSVFREVVEKGRIYYGETGDETIRSFFAEIGKPANPAMVLLPLISNQKVVAVIYGDFGQKEAAPVQLDILEVLSLQAGIVLEYMLFRKQVTKTAPK